MLGSKLFATLALGIVLLITSTGQILADNTKTQPLKWSTVAASSCAKITNPARKVRIIVRFTRTPSQDSKEMRACYDTLNQKQKAQVFYQTAKKLGLSAKLDQELGNASAQKRAPLQYGSLLMPYAAVAVGQLRTAELYWIDNGSRCPTGRGTEYNFQYRFANNVTNPASLRSNSPTNVLVDAAIAWYTVNYGGQKTWYDTTSPVITACVGDTSLNTVGGANVWKANAVVIKP